MDEAAGSTEGFQQMTLDLDRIRRETFVRRVEFHASIGSTNDRAKECAAADSIELPLLVIADRQTAGRGRGTNRWWTGPGALAFSLLVDGQTVGADHGPAPLVALATAVAVVDAINPLLPDQPVGLHWPNDVFAGDRKLAGILIEAMPNRRHVIGIGLNVNNSAADAPAELRDSVGTLRDMTGQTHDGTTILVDVLKRLEREFERLRNEPEAIAARANDLCFQRGAMLTLQWAGRTVSGQCLGIAADGALQLATSGGNEAFYSGTVTASRR